MRTKTFLAPLFLDLLLFCFAFSSSTGSIENSQPAPSVIADQKQDESEETV